MRKIKVKFKEINDLVQFNERNNLQLTNLTKSYNFITKEEIKKKESRIINKKPKTDYEKHWVDMPLFNSEKWEFYAIIDFYFEDDYDLKLLQNIFEQNITLKTISIWYPKLIHGRFSKLRVVGGGIAQPRYPIYIVSKDRADYCTTSRFLSQMQVKHYVVVEPNDFKEYKEKVENKYATILELDMSYKDNYDTFDDLGDSKGKGPGGARNFCWDDSIKKGFKWHWVFDDNANEGFHYFWKSIKVKCRTGAYFCALEDFVDRYENIAQAGLNYSKFVIEGYKEPPYILNTRIYSFLLIRNDIPYRWRGRYNEDTDLSLRILKDGWCTVQFNGFLAGKATTQKIKGGNNEMFYSKEGTYSKSKMLEDMHPDVAKVVWKFHRWHHYVDYSGFKQQLILKKDYISNNKVNNYGMIIIDTDEKETTDTKEYLETKYKDKLKNNLLKE